MYVHEDRDPVFGTLGQDASSASGESSDVVPSMTGEQFAWHLVGVLHLLNRLPRILGAIAGTIPDACRTEMEARVARLTYPIDPSALVGSDVSAEDVAACAEGRVDRLLGWIKSIEYEADITNLVLGPDWRDVGVDHRNAAAVAYRLGAVEPIRAKRWYEGVTSMIAVAQGSIRSELDHELELAQIDLAFWIHVDEVSNWPLTVLRTMLEELGKFAAAVAEAAGGAIGAAGEGLAAGLWKAVKPLILPALLVGAGYVAWTMRYQIHAALTSAGSAPALPRRGKAGEAINVASRLLPEAAGTDGLGFGGGRRLR